MGNHLVGYAARVAADARGIKLDGSIEPAWPVHIRFHQQPRTLRRYRNHLASA